jgi:hypothetical protein
MKRLGMFLLAVAMCLLLGQTAHGSEREILLAAGGIQASGTVVWAGTFQFRLSKDGEKTEYVLSEGTIYSPESRRLAIGDSVDIIYFEPEIASGSELQKLSMFVEIHREPTFKIMQNEWFDAVVLSAGIQSVVAVPILGKTLRVEGFKSAYEDASRSKSASTFPPTAISFLPNLGDKIKIKLNIVPQSRGGSYVYRVKEVRL